MMAVGRAVGGSEDRGCGCGVVVLLLLICNCSDCSVGSLSSCGRHRGEGGCMYTVLATAGSHPVGVEGNNNNNRESQIE